MFARQSVRHRLKKYRVHSYLYLLPWISLPRRGDSQPAQVADPDDPCWTCSDIVCQLSGLEFCGTDFFRRTGYVEDDQGG